MLALTMLLTCASAMAEIPATFHAEGMPIVDEPVSFSVLTMRWGDMGDSFTTNPFLVNLEKEANVKVDWQIVSSNDWSDHPALVLLRGRRTRTAGVSKPQRSLTRRPWTISTLPS